MILLACNGYSSFRKKFALLIFFDNLRFLKFLDILKILLRVGTNLYSSGSAKKAVPLPNSWLQFFEKLVLKNEIKREKI